MLLEIHIQIVQHGIQIKNGIMKNANANVKTIKRAKKMMIGIIVHAVAKIVSIIDDSVITCDEVINIIYSVSKIVTSAMSINFEDKRKKI